MLPPFADYSTGEAGGLLAAAVALTTLAIKVGDWLKLWRREGREQDRKDESETLARMEAMLDRVERDLEASKQENRRLTTLIDSIRVTAEREMQKCRDEAHRATVRAERAVVWIRNVEAFLRSRNINDFAPWADEPGPVVPHGPAPTTDVSDDGGYP